MKKRLFSAVAFASLLSACATSPKYTINGTVEGEETGNIYIVELVGEKMDTLNSSEIKDGKFKFEGVVNEVAVAAFTIEGKRAFTPIFLENATYTVKLDPTKPANSSITGTETHALAAKYAEINNSSRAEQAKLYKEYSQASQAQDEDKMNEIRTLYTKVEEEAAQKTDSIMNANPASIATAAEIAQKMGGMDLTTLKTKYDALSADVKASKTGQKINNRITTLESVAIGQVAPDFTLNTPDGQPLSMHSIKGKVKIIDFWASWCGPCRAVNPHVVSLYEKYHGKGLEILGVSLDRDKDAWTKAISDDKLAWNHVSDLKYWQCEPAKAYAVNGIPHLVIVDENNKIVAKNLHGDQLEAKIKELIEAN
ncbi:MAG: redoxin family protein [Marinifilaceae bacterium]